MALRSRWIGRNPPLATARVAESGQLGSPRHGGQPNATLMASFISGGTHGTSSNDSAIRRGVEFLLAGSAECVHIFEHRFCRLTFGGVDPLPVFGHAIEGGDAAASASSAAVILSNTSRAAACWASTPSDALRPRTPSRNSARISSRCSQ